MSEAISNWSGLYIVLIWTAWVAFKIIKESRTKTKIRGNEEIKAGDIVAFEDNNEGFSAFGKRAIEGTVEAIQPNNEKWESKIVVIGEDKKRRILLKRDVIKVKEAEK